MSIHLRSLIITTFVCLCVALPVSAGPINIGGSYNVSGTNFPVNFGPTAVTLDTNPHLLAGGALQVQAEIEDIDVNSQWLEFGFSTTDGSSIAGNLSSLWNFTISDIPYSEPALFGAFYYYWSIDGTPVQNIQNWLGGVLFDDTGINPRNPANGPVFGGISNPPGPTFNPSLFINPFDLISTMVPGGVDPSLINDFHVGMLVTAQNPVPEVPEPTSMALFGLTALGMGVMRRRSKKKATEEVI